MRPAKVITADVFDHGRCPSLPAPLRILTVYEAGRGSYTSPSAGSRCLPLTDLDLLLPGPAPAGFLHLHPFALDLGFEVLSDGRF